MNQNRTSYPVFKGSIPAMITPMNANGDVDYEAFKRLIEWHIAEGSDALVIVGTSGESSTLDFDEHEKLIALSVEHAEGRIPIIAGVGGNATAEAIRLTKSALKAGATAGLSVVPYYNKPTQEGMYQHFKAIAQSTELPIILYNVPGRTVASMDNETICRLAEVPGIMGIKDATGDIARGAMLLTMKPSHFQVYSGDDPTAAALIMLGGQANISVTANVAPKMMHQLCIAAYEGDIQTVQALNKKLMPLNKALFVESNPIPVKWAVSKMGLSTLGYRLPLTPMSSSFEPKLLEAMKIAEVI